MNLGRMLAPVVVTRADVLRRVDALGGRDGPPVLEGPPDIIIMHRLISGELNTSPRAVNPDVPEALDRICQRAIAYRADDRYATAAEFQADLEAFIAEQGHRASPREIGKFVGDLHHEKREKLRAIVDARLTAVQEQRSSAPRPPLLTSRWQTGNHRSPRRVRRHDPRALRACCARDGTAGAIAELHARRAEALLAVDDWVELRAHHAIRGHPDFEAFLLVEESARMRLLHCDHEAAIAALCDGMYAARSLVSKGEGEAATSAWIVFGRKLAAIQIDLGRHHEARTILTDIVERLRPGDTATIEILD